MTLSVSDLTVEYVPPRRALNGVSLCVRPARTLAVVGPSGAGKTTLLRTIAGLQRAQSGDVLLDGASIAARTPQERRVALVFQDDALFGHLSVAGNLRFALRRGSKASVARTAAALQIEELLERRPRQLSGGERQRAAMARALLSEPTVLLMDEPLAHVDPSLRRSVRDAVLGVRNYFAGPIVYVTHGHAEAMSVADELAVLIDGRIEDGGEPQRVYDAPRTLRVAAFLGDWPMNLLDDGRYVLGIRVERVRIERGGRLAGARDRS